MTKEEIGQIIRLSRLGVGLTQLQVAERLGRPQQTIANWESGKSQPDANTLFELFRVLDRSVDEAFGFESEKTPPISGEAMKVAKDFECLDQPGKNVVKVVIAEEGKRVQAEKERGLTTEEPPAVVSFPKAKRNGSGIVEIRVYDQPAAAGLGNYLDEPDYHLEQYPAEVIPTKADFGIIISGDSMEPKIHDGGTVFVQSAPSIDPGKIGIFILNDQAYCKKLAVDRENRQVRLASLNPKYEDIIVGEADEIRTVGRVLGQWTPGQRQDMFGW